MYAGAVTINCIILKQMYTVDQRAPFTCTVCTFCICFVPQWIYKQKCSNGIICNCIWRILCSATQCRNALENHNNTLLWYFVSLHLCVNYCFHCRKALLLLKKKRYQDQLLDKTENQISNLERMVRVWWFLQNPTEIWSVKKMCRKWYMCCHSLLFVYCLKVSVVTNNV